MESLFYRFYNFIEKDIKAQGESKTMAVLIRYISCFLMIYNVIMTTIFALRGAFPFFLLFIAGLILAVATLYITYTSNVSRALITLGATVDIIALVGTFVTYWIYGFQYLLVSMMLVVFFNMTWNMFKRVLIALMHAFILVVLAIVSFPLPEEIIPPGAAFGVNLAIFIVMIISVGMAYSRKFSASEYKLYEYNKKLERMAGSDPLTGLLNRRYMSDILHKLESRYKQERVPLAMAMGDIDFFKKVNDTYGHDSGDVVLKEIAAMLTEFMDDKGYVSRWGGEEFLLVFRGINADEVFQQLEIFRDTVQKKDIVSDEKVIKVTMTFGLEEFSTHVGIDETIKRADEKLYLGKNGGRNRVVY
ncbi:MAG: GGDEF domain-containing protein [Lachnospiraceae bacterium]|nr:GGDEF domain-containing protein [Lachnospiraceae bacterium]